MPTFVKVEVRAKLRVTGKLQELPALDTTAKPGSPASYRVDEASLATGAELETEQLGIIEIYFGGAAELQEAAKKLNGKAVLVSGDLDRITYYSGKHLEPAKVKIWYSPATHWWERPDETTILMPSWVTKTFIRAKRIEPAPAP